MTQLAGRSTLDISYFVAPPAPLSILLDGLLSTLGLGLGNGVGGVSYLRAFACGEE